MEIVQAVNKTPEMPSTLRRGTVLNNKLNLVAKLEEENRQAATGLVDLSSSLTQELLVQLLVNGSPKAYIELFELTQMIDEPPNADGEDAESEKVKSPNSCSSSSSNNNDNNNSTMRSSDGLKEYLHDREKLRAMQHLLEVIEVASKSGPLGELFQAQLQMGNIFDDVGDLEKSIFYHSSSLTIAQQMGDPRNEAQAKLNLGKAYKRMNMHMEALQCFEDFYSMATAAANDMSEGIADVTQNLLEVYVTCAEEADKATDLQTSIEFYNKCLDLANVGNHARVAADAKHELGLQHYRLQNHLVALEYQTAYLSYCNSVNDNMGMTKGHGAAAEVFAALGKVDGEIYHLENLLDVSKLLDKTTEARAYCRLGMAYTRQGQLDYATTYFERYYKLACELNDVQMISFAKINLGLTRAGPPESPCSSPSRQATHGIAVVHAF